MSTVFNKAWINALLNQADSSKRIFPMGNSGGLRNVVTKRDAPIMREFTAGGKEYIRDAARTWTGIVSGAFATPRNEGIINGFRCKPYGVYIVDRGQNVIGVLSSATGNCDVCNCDSDYRNTGIACSKIMRDPYNLLWMPLYANDGTRNGILLDSGAYLYPIPVDQESVYATFGFNDGKNNASEIMFAFDFQQDFKDSTLSMIPCSSFTDWQPSMIRGLIDVCPVFSAIDDTTFTVELQTADGDAVNTTLAQGFILADFTLKNVTQSTTITITSVTESTSTPGQYIFIFPAVAEGDVLQLIPSKTGFDCTCVANTVIATPAS